MRRGKAQSGVAVVVRSGEVRSGRVGLVVAVSAWYGWDRRGSVRLGAAVVERFVSVLYG